MIKQIVKKGMASTLSLLMLLAAVPGLSEQSHAAKDDSKSIAIKTEAKVVDVKGKVRLSVKKIKGKDLSKKVTFKSSNRKIATVNKKGIVTGKKTGKVKITVISKKKKTVKSSVKLKVKDLKPVRLKVSPKNVSLSVAGSSKTSKIKVTATPRGVYCPVRFKSSDSKIVKVKKDGTVVGIKEGQAFISVTSTEKNKKGKRLTSKIKVRVQSDKAINNKPENNSGPAEHKPSQPDKPSAPPTVMQNKLADGVWYGTGTDSFYYEEKGPDIIKASIINGKIKDVNVVKWVEDEPYRYGEDILQAAIGSEDVSNLRKQLKEHAGDAYDTVSGATRTAEGHLSALENALERSAKYQKDKKEQRIAYMDFENRPGGQAIGETLDISNVVFRVHFNNGSSEIVPFGKLSEYGITATPNHGSKLPEVGKTFIVHFRQNDSLIDIPLRKQVMKERIPAYATHALLHLEDGSEVKVEMNEDDFVYKVNIEDDVESAELFHEGRKLADGVKTSYNDEWEFNIKGVPLPDGNYTHWKFEDYRIRPKNINAGFTAFEIDIQNVKKEYSVGEKLDLSEITITATNKKGEQEIIRGWEAAVRKGFDSYPKNGSFFMKSDAGEKTITIKYNNGGNMIEKSFKAEVNEIKANIPAQIEVMCEGEEVCSVEVDGDKFTEGNGHLRISDVKIPKKYENWNLNDFEIHVTNADGDEIETKPQKMGNMLQLDLPGYLTSDGFAGYVMLFFKYV